MISDCCRPNGARLAAQKISTSYTSTRTVRSVSIAPICRRRSRRRWAKKQTACCQQLRILLAFRHPILGGRFSHSFTVRLYGQFSQIKYFISNIFESYSNFLLKTEIGIELVSFEAKYL